ncbi:MAG TPA: hypothetical protein VGQ44_04470 [Gemmatimonadaceae bacterium]|jgi:hypothetical protein|nr:hypothetical protein [Gemmatimonadaceae bacterium]
MSSSARRDELLYESDAALRLVDRAIQEMRVSEESEDASAEAVSVAAGDAPVEDQRLNAAD